MRKLIHLVHTSLDGFIDGPDGEFDWPAMGPELSAYGRELNARVDDTFLYGRVVWEMMSGFWPHAESLSDDPHDLDFAPVWRAMPKLVASRTLTEAGWNARVIRDDVGAQLAALTARPGKDILLTGGSNLAAGLTRSGLIDEYHVVVHPVVLGGGKPAFLRPDGRISLTLVESRTFDDRAVLLRYERADRRR
jgi:dihydrofolate reductase